MNKRQVQELKIKDILSPEEIVARGRRAKLRFRSAIRFVIQNLYWLTDIEDDELGDDFQKNILVLTRKKKSLLTLEEKGLLSKPAEYRTEEEKIRLGRKISGLKCFRRYPMDVKKQLAGVTYFYYYGPGRTIVRQGHESNALYFIITGEVSISQDFYDPIQEEMVNREVGAMKAGSMFGEITLLHDIPRTSTVTTRSHVEVLCLKKEDFNVILKATVQEQWDAVKNAMQLFTYFDDWATNTIRDGCILGKLKTFRPEETILGDGYGYDTYVYFILSGRCQVIEHLMVTAEIKGGRKFFKLYVPTFPGDRDTDLLDLFEGTDDTKTESILTVSKERKVKKSEPLEEGEDIASQSKMIIMNIDESEALRKDKEIPGSYQKFEPKKRESAVTFKSSDTTMSKRPSIKNKADEVTSGEGRKSSKSSGSSRVSVNGSPDNKPSVRTTTAATITGAASRHSSNISNICLPPAVETYFMQVCVLNATACFNIGENLRHRRIVATKTTECLLIPRYWLIQQNKGNIWNRVRQFLITHIPTTKQIFQEFLKQRKWMVYRRKIFQDIKAKYKISSNNNVNNVPYFIRINEELPIY